MLEPLLDIDCKMFNEYEIECRNKRNILDWEIAYIYPKDNDLVVEIKGE